jgi:hypothetical protein
MRLLMICVMVSALGLQSCQQQEVEEINILENSGFEQAQNGTPEEWDRRTDLPEGSSIYATSDVAYSGKRSLCIEVAADVPDESLSFSRQVVEDPPKTERIALTGVIRTENLAEGAVVSLVARSIANDGEVIGFSTTERTHTFTGTNNWTPVETRFAVPKNANHLEVWTLLTGGGTVWFDDVRLTQEIPVEED